MDKYELHLGDCLKVLSTMSENSVDAVVTDPPYGLTSDGKKGFMGHEWDKGVPGVEFWKEILRVAKPGAHMLAFGGCRTYHRLACAIEDAGWEVRDCIMWVYGSGFPKSLDISKAIDKAAGVEREVIGTKVGLPGYSLKHQGAGGVLSGRADGSLDNSEGECVITAPATDLAKKFSGWGTSLKPAYEPILLCRKPLIGTVVKNILQYGTGGINIDVCRVPTEETVTNHSRSADAAVSKGKYGDSQEQETHQTDGQKRGRFPSNFIHDNSEEVVSLFPNSKTNRIEKPSNCSVEGATSFNSMRGNRPARGYNGEGSAARFFYCAKASKKDRDENLDDFEEKACGMMEDDNYDIKTGSGNSMDTKRKNTHPTVKPTNLLRYLCKMVCPKNGIILDPFMGSGSTGKAAMLEGFRFIGIELEKDYMEIAKARIEAAAKEPEEPEVEPEPNMDWIK